MTRRWVLLAVLVTLLALTPLALADHAYSHRFIVYGRVVDANGDPVPGTTVNLGTRDFPGAEGACAQQPGTATEAFGPTETRPVTNGYGEFVFCYHSHEINRVEPPTGILQVAEFNYTREFRFDPYTRVAFEDIHLDTVVERANATLLETGYTVFGRFWQAAGDRVTVEGIGVFGTTVNHAMVNVTLTLPDGTTVRTNTSTNAYGDFSIRLPVPSRPTGGTVTIESGGHTFTGDVDPKLGATAFRVELEKPVDPFVRTALIGLGVIVAIGVVAGFGWYGYRKLESRRDVESSRATSTRKRAKR